jgi:hypothetical protein
MANPEHVKILRQGAKSWNKWRSRYWNEATGDWALLPDLSGADLNGADLLEYNFSGANLGGADLTTADLRDADLSRARLRRAKLCQANMHETNLYECDLCDADLTNANLMAANLSGAYLAKADLSGANLDRAMMVESVLSQSIMRGTSMRRACLHRAILVNADLTDAILMGASVHGISAWDVKKEGLKQRDLVVTPLDQSPVTVDDLEVAQFVYMLLKNEKIRDIIDTIGQQGVLILGRFTPERKAVLDAIRNKLRQLGFVPMMFDFEKPTQRDFTETIKTLAGMSRFIIADITNPKSAPLELQATIPDYMIPFVPIIDETEEPFSMFRDLKQKYGDWVLDVLEYDSVESLIDVLDEAVIKPALEKAYELIDRKAESLKKRHVKDYRKNTDP